MATSCIFATRVNAVEKRVVVEVIVDAKTAGNDARYTYSDFPAAQIGQAVLAPLGPRTVIGFIWDRREVTEAELGFPFSRLRALSGTIENLILPAPVRNLVEFVADEYITAVSTALIPAVPPGVKERLVTTWSLVGNADLSDQPDALKETLRAIVDQGGKLREKVGQPMEAAAKRSLRKLRDLGVVAETLEVTAIKDVSRIQGSLRLIADSEKIDRFLITQGRKRPAQAHVLMVLQGMGSGSMTAVEVKALTGCTDQTLKALVAANMLEEFEAESAAPKTPPMPNVYQAEAIQAIIKAIESQEFQPFLLYGVTGSGKTEVYMRAAAAALKAGKQVLILVPEISLTAQVVGILNERFGSRVALLHSNLSPTERLTNWLRIASGEAPLILGARSAIFAPLTNVGLIILDEEHDGSYKQETSPRYQAKSCAMHLAKHFNAPIVLGSATPSLESAVAAKNGDFTLLPLPYRASAASLPSVDIVNLTDIYRDRKMNIFTEVLETKIRDRIERKEQTILFLNRRAYAPSLICRDCGHTHMCPHCAVTLAYHKGSKLVKCHHCGYKRPAPETCPECQGDRIAPFGTGVERVELACRETFENARVARLDRDVAKRKGAMEEIFAMFRAGELDILVGTQMLAKGLDFPGVTLVGVIAADISLNIPDFRSSERTFQLLCQVAGRAGRGDRPGEVVIQTFHPEHPAIELASAHDFDQFFERQVSEREEAGYPPFVKLVNVLLVGPERPQVERTANSIAATLRKNLVNSQVLGPVECPLERLNDQWRIHMLVKMPTDAASGPLGELLHGIVLPANVKLTVDVDPYSLM